MSKARPRAIERPPEPRGLDFGTLSLFVGHACADAVQHELAERGFGDARFSHGYLFQHLIEGDRTIGELAARLGVTQQATSKSIAEVERLGFVETVADERDARRRLVRLSERGRAVIDAARRARAALETKLERKHGAAALAQGRALLADVLHGLGGTESVRLRKVRAPR